MIQPHYQKVHNLYMVETASVLIVAMQTTRIWPAQTTYIAANAQVARIMIPPQRHVYVIPKVQPIIQRIIVVLIRRIVIPVQGKLLTGT